MTCKAKKNLPFRPVEDMDFPREIQIQTHTACNARCVMCPYGATYKEVSHGKMRPDLFKRIIKECSEHNVYDMKPFLMNEPLLDNRLPNFIRYARECLPDTIIGFSTNGQLLEGTIAEELLDSGIDEIWVNFNGITKETYEAIMKGLSFEHTKQNILNFKQNVVHKGADIQIFISTVETQLNIEEIEAIKVFWRKYDIPVATTPLNNRGGNIQTDSLRVLENIKDYRVCDRPFYKMYIAYDGNVILCSSDWKRSTIVGNVEADGIYQVWHSDKQDEIRKWILHCNWIKLPNCGQCDYIAIYK